MSKIRKEDYSKIIKVHNESGMKAAMEYITNNFGTKYPRDVITRIKKRLDTVMMLNKKIIEDNVSTEKTIFMDIDELCKGAVCTESKPANVSFIGGTRKPAIEMIYQELIQEKFLELNKYIKLNRYLNTISIDKTALIANGYQVSIY